MHLLKNPTELNDQWCIRWNSMQKLFRQQPTINTQSIIMRPFSELTLFFFAVFVCAVHKAVRCTRTSVAVISLREILSNFVLFSFMFTVCKKWQWLVWVCFVIRYRRSKVYSNKQCHKFFTLSCLLCIRIVFLKQNVKKLLWIRVKIE